MDNMHEKSYFASKFGYMKFDSVGFNAVMLLFLPILGYLVRRLFKAAVPILCRFVNVVLHFPFFKS